MRSCFAISLLTVAVASALPAWSMDHVTLRQDNKRLAITGRILTTAQDGGLLLLARDGVLWPVQPDELLERTSDDLPFKPFSAEEMSQRVLGELPSGFEVYRTAHYLICHNASREYAVWCGSLFERLTMAFTNFWSRRGFAIQTPEFPLVAVVFADRQSYEQFARKELGDAVGAIIGYYSLRTNRMTMFDLTGMAGLERAPRGTTAAQISRILAQPEAERMVATIVHEATHQIAYNCGLHARFSDCPLWFSEGIAVYFETPDVSSAKGWSTVGAVNLPRLAQFRDYARRRPSDSLVSLIRDGTRFRDTSKGLDAYAEAWALTYFLLKQRPKQYVEYLRTLSAKEPAKSDDPEIRLHEFKRAFGPDLKRLDSDFLRFILRLR